MLETETDLRVEAVTGNYEPFLHSQSLYKLWKRIGDTAWPVVYAFEALGPRVRSRHIRKRVLSGSAEQL
jgi:hypothetical protein